MFFEKSGQGTIEYLVIIGVVVILALAVVGVLISQTNSSESISKSTSLIKQKTGVYGVSIAEGVIGSDQNGLLVLKNSSGENLIITKINIEGEDHNFSAQFLSGEEKAFKLQGVESCAGLSRSYLVKIYYTSISGLEKVADFEEIVLECVPQVIPVGFCVEETILDSSSPELTLNTPVENPVIFSDTNTNFSFYANEPIVDCNLYLENYLQDRNEEYVLQNTNINLDLNAALFGEGGHNYDLNCADSSGNIGTLDGTITYSPQDTTPPVISLYLPLDNNPINSADSNIEFIFSSSQDTNACYLYFGEVGDWNLIDQNISLVEKDTNYFMDFNIAIFGVGNYYWDVNCTDTNGVLGTAMDRNISYSPSQVASANLLTNPGMETGNYTGWSSSITAGVFGACLGGLTLCIGNGSVYEGNYSVYFSYLGSTLSQEIDLLSKGYSASYLDAVPDVNIVDHVIGFFNTSDYYRLKVELRNASHGVLTSYNTGILTSSGSWVTLNNLFTNYGSGLRYIYYERYGDDVEYWSGSYGPVFDGAEVYFVD